MAIYTHGQLVKGVRIDAMTKKFYQSGDLYRAASHVPGDGKWYVATNDGWQRIDTTKPYKDPDGHVWLYQKVTNMWYRHTALTPKQDHYGDW